MVRVTDDEKRRISAWFRECAKSRNYWPGIMKIAEVLSVPHTPWDGTEGRLLDAWADLIEPTPNSSEDAPKIDRDEMLAIADECDEMRDDGYLIGSYEVYRISRRIREACGVVKPCDAQS